MTKRVDNIHTLVGFTMLRIAVPEGKRTMAQKKFVFIITHSFDRPDLAAGAFQLAANMRAFDIEVDFFLMDNGALLAKKGYAETMTWQRKDQFAPVHELMKTLVDDFNCKFYICASCVKHFQLDQVEVIANASGKPGSERAELLLEREALSC